MSADTEAGRGGRRFEFKAGDVVPGWIQRVSPPSAAAKTVFGCDVRGTVAVDGAVTIWAAAGGIAEGEYMIGVIGHHGPITMVGAPTYFIDRMYHPGDDPNPWRIKTNDPPHPAQRGTPRRNHEREDRAGPDAGGVGPTGDHRAGRPTGTTPPAPSVVAGLPMGTRRGIELVDTESFLC